MTEQSAAAGQEQPEVREVTVAELSPFFSPEGLVHRDVALERYHRTKQATIALEEIGRLEAERAEVERERDELRARLAELEPAGEVVSEAEAIVAAAEPAEESPPADAAG